MIAVAAGSPPAGTAESESDGSSAIEVVEIVYFNVQFWYQGKTKNAIVSNFTKVWGLKEIVHNKIDLGPHLQMFNFKGECLDDDDEFLTGYGIGKDSTLNLVAKDPNAIGGMAPKVRKADKLKDAKEPKEKTTRPGRVKNLLDIDLKQLATDMQKFEKDARTATMVSRLRSKVKEVVDQSDKGINCLAAAFETMQASDLNDLIAKLKSTNTIETRNKLLLKVILTPVFQDMDTEVAELHQLILDTSAVLSYVFEKSPDYRTAEGLTLWANINLEIECIAAAKIKAR